MTHVQKTNIGEQRESRLEGFAKGGSEFVLQACKVTEKKGTWGTEVLSIPGEATLMDGQTALLNPVFR